MIKTKYLLKIFGLLTVYSFLGLIAVSCRSVKRIEYLDSSNGSYNPSKMDLNESNNPLIIGIKKELDLVLNNKRAILDSYADYSKIRSELEKAYTAAEVASSSNNVSVKELDDARKILEFALTKAEQDKDNFDKQHQNLVFVYKNLKDNLSNRIRILSSLNEDKYFGIKDVLEKYYLQAQKIINDSVDADDLTEDKINDINLKITNITSDLDSKKTNIDEYSEFKKFVIQNQNFKGSFIKNATNNEEIVTYITSIANNNWKYAKRKIQNVNNNDLSKITDVSWIYDLRAQNSSNASYDLIFDYYGGSNATLWFPYKTYSSNQNINNLGLQYKLNDNQITDISSLISNATINEIKVAEINLTGLNFGNNKISFSVPQSKENPMIGNFFITLSNDEEYRNKVYDAIFGTEKNPLNENEVVVNFVKGYGIAKKVNMYQTLFTKRTSPINDMGDSTDQYVLGYLGNVTGAGDNNNVKFYTFYVNIPKTGRYNISGIINTGDRRGIYFWKDRFENNQNHAKFINLTSFNNWDKLKTFDSNDGDGSTSTSLQLTKGLNKIIVSGDSRNRDAPNLGNIKFTLKN
ncbi:hypothetical protein LNO75_00360 [Mycoplasma sp. T363T]|uniref:hypothetical protein n=1 Tax=Mycoplasma bradburyae TaxID=2963128 RepID=UPI00234275D4|nr:hypothetical protein [Mycoplasma bradburyae]MDC4163033.1 hypothetical protein [Mycoplasma bradburyae]